MIIKETITNSDRWDNIKNEIVELKDKYLVLITLVKIDDNPLKDEALKELKSKLKYLMKHTLITQKGLTAQLNAKKNNRANAEKELGKITKEAIVALTKSTREELEVLRPIFEDLKND